MFYKTSDFYVGIRFVFKSNPYELKKFHYHKPGKGASIVRVRLKHLITKSITVAVFRSGDKFEKVDLDERTIKFLYKNVDYVFLETETMEKVTICDNIIGDYCFFLKKDVCCQMLVLNNEPIDLVFPNYLSLKVIECDMNNISNKTKTVVLETKLKCDVPLFIEVNDVININTKTFTYISKCNKKT
jgi:elongation factor P